MTENKQKKNTRDTKKIELNKRLKSLDYLEQFSSLDYILSDINNNKKEEKKIILKL